MEKFSPPKEGVRIVVRKSGLDVPENPVIPFIEGDGIGPDIMNATQKVLNAAVEKTYDGSRKLCWYEIFAGEKAQNKFGEWIPNDTFEAIQHYSVALKGPLTTPVGRGFRSLNVTLRQKLDLYACVRPVRYFEGVPAPVKEPQKMDMVIFRENSEDIYAGIEWNAGTAEAQKVITFLQTEMGVKKIRFPGSSSIGIKPVSKEGTERLVRRAIQYAIDQNRSSVTLVHKGNIMKFTEGGFKSWGYDLARREFGATLIDQGPWMRIKNPKGATAPSLARPPRLGPIGETGKEIVIKDVIADAFLQQILLRPAEYSVIATLNLNGDYISDALAAQVGGIGIAPGANLSDTVAMFEATHGTAPKYAGKDMVNPGSIILSAEMMLRHLGWGEAADFIIKGMTGAIQAKTVTYDFARLMKGAKKVSCSAFGEAVIRRMGGRPAAGQPVKKAGRRKAVRPARKKTARPATRMRPKAKKKRIKARRR